MTQIGPLYRLAVSTHIQAPVCIYIQGRGRGQYSPSSGTGTVEHPGGSVLDGLARWTGVVSESLARWTGVFSGRH